MRSLVYIVLGLLVACDQSTPIVDTPEEAETEVSSVRAEAEARRLREMLPGKQHYDQVCASCHDGKVKAAPHRDMIGLMTPEAILNSITDGIMRTEAAALSAEQKMEVAEYLSGGKLGKELVQLPSCGPAVKFDLTRPASAQNWGIQRQNTRVIDTDAAGINSGNVNSLQQKWAVAFPGANRVRSQPVFAGGLMFIGTHGGQVYALDGETGCALWSYQASGEVRTGIVVAPWSEAPPMIYFGDVLANVYGVDAGSGEQVWRYRADDHPNATITGTPSLGGDMLYVPVSSLEVSLAVNPHYECCTFQGSVVALDAASGAPVWKTFTIPDEPRVTGKNPIGTNIIGPSGAVVWNSPSIDSENNQLYVGTGENMSSPASLTSDAILAMDLDTGRINWTFQATANDVWNTACDTDTPENCPVEDGPDFDFGGATIIVDTTAHGPLVIAGQKSGVVHALSPETGELVWQTRVGRGGIQGGIHFGIAASGQTLLVPISDMPDGRSYDHPDRPGMHALDASTGEILWTRLHENQCGDRRFCDPGISQVPTVIGDMVFAGAMDGVTRAYDIASGKVLWELDTTDTYTTVSGTATSGGSMSGAAGPIAHKGKLVLSSGYGLYNHMPGNLLLVLEVND